MIIASFLPFIGTPLIFVPAGLIQIFSGNYISGIGILIFGFVIIMNIDNLIKPKLISAKSRLHPAIILVGVFGGLKVMGFVGILLGPIILALMLVLLRVYAKDFRRSSS
jgi:predicted PurR-regulated permease PerM